MWSMSHAGLRQERLLYVGSIRTTSSSSHKEVTKVEYHQHGHFHHVLRPAS